MRAVVTLTDCVLSRGSRQVWVSIVSETDDKHRGRAHPRSKTLDTQKASRHRDGLSPTRDCDVDGLRRFAFDRHHASEHCAHCLQMIPCNMYMVRGNAALSIWFFWDGLLISV